MTDTALPSLARPGGDDAVQAARSSHGGAFLFLLAVATAGPWLALPVLAEPAAEGGISNQVKTLIVFLGSGAHVAASYAFYLDPAIRPLLRGHPWRYWYVPIAIVVGSGLLFAVGGERLTATALLAYFVWQTHHYTRQNVGVFSFAARARCSARPSELERAAITTAGFAGIIGMITFLAPYERTPLAQYAVYLHPLAFVVYVGSIALFVACVPQARRARDPIRLAFLAGGVLFYLPTFLYRDAFSAVASYAIAHGCQYLVFMGWVGGAARREQGSRLLGTVIVLIVGGGLLLRTMERGALFGLPDDVVFGVYLGIVMTHFVVDAGVWRLSEPFQRRYMAERFDFLAS